MSTNQIVFLLLALVVCILVYNLTKRKKYLHKFVVSIDGDDLGVCYQIQIESSEKVISNKLFNQELYNTVGEKYTGRYYRIESHVIFINDILYSTQTLDE